MENKKFEIEIYRDGQWTNDIEGTENYFETQEEAEDAISHLAKVWNMDKEDFRVVEIGGKTMSYKAIYKNNRGNKIYTEIHGEYKTLRGAKLALSKRIKEKTEFGVIEKNGESIAVIGRHTNWKWEIK